MKLLLGDESIAGNVAKNYFLSLKNKTPLESYVYSRSDCYLDLQSCNLIHDLTFLDPMLPFGLVDKNTTVGQVETKSNNIQYFNIKMRDTLRKIAIIKELSEVIQETIKAFIPLAPVGDISNLRTEGSGKSAHWLKGAVFLSLPQDHAFPHLELAINLVHEVGHQVLMFYQDADPLIKREDFGKPVYSAIRKTSRPAIMSLHALVAIHFMYYFVTKTFEIDSSLTTSEKIYLQKKKTQLSADFASGCFALKGINLTPIGLDIVMEMITYFRDSRTA